MRDLLKKVEQEELFDFLEEYAEYNPKFDNAIHSRFSKPVFQDELDKISEVIDDALKNVLDYRQRDNWGCVNVNTSDIIFEINQRAAQGNIKLAFSEIEMLFRKLITLFEYQGECEISNEVDYCLDLMSDIAKQATDIADKEYIYDHCIDLAYLDDGKNYGEDYTDQLLDISVQFVTQENRAKFDAALMQLKHVEAASEVGHDKK
jgi:hypothetical protein